jgi:hypothetical protein
MTKEELIAAILSLPGDPAIKLTILDEGAAISFSWTLTHDDLRRINATIQFDETTSPSGAIQ